MTLPDPAIALMEVQAQVQALTQRVFELEKVPLALVERITALTLNPGDTVVVKVGASITREWVDMLHEDLRDAFPDNTTMVIVTPDEIVDITVVSGGTDG